MASKATALAALILCIVGPTFLGLAIRNELRARALDDHGVVALAEVTAVTADRDTDADERVAYRLTVDGTAYDGANRHLEHGPLVLARTLGHIEVRYLPEDPSVNAPTQAATRRTQVVAFALSITLTLAAIAVLSVLVASKRKTGRWWG